jgi:hypothetical protein
VVMIPTPAIPTPTGFAGFNGLAGLLAAAGFGSSAGAGARAGGSQQQQQPLPVPHLRYCYAPYTIATQLLAAADEVQHPGTVLEYLSAGESRAPLQWRGVRRSGC